jgi:hypothetical protein
MKWDTSLKLLAAERSTHVEKIKCAFSLLGKSSLVQVFKESVTKKIFVNV